MTGVPLRIIEQVGTAGLPTPVKDTLTEVWQGVIGDRVAAWRLKNAAAIQVKLSKELDALGTKPDLSRIPERYAITWFEEATKQDEPEIQELFAKLLARAADGNPDAADRRILSIVGEMTPADAIAFKGIFAFDRIALSRGYERLEEINVADFRYFNYVEERIGDRTSLAVEHLHRLGLLESRSELKSPISSQFGRGAVSGTFAMTAIEGLAITDKSVTTHTAWALYAALGLSDQLVEQKPADCR